MTHLVVLFCDLLSLIRRLPNCSRSKATVITKQNRGESFLFLSKKWNFGRILFVFIHSVFKVKVKV